ncbi:hypothetical protein GUITHDRAFT_118301 [Guillardia theta CCMP2712]|uniref:Uncharacterized protein n=1 Tax=Guillardia theta (strain CCMP2712) TaxID=905079 RepID=L1IHB9_GUITC|nr:hypothetical protein GUITHDRAFT_118301 [Guillardia theta CCMP2712]EKX35487.1 hypothetical protein GUITHDRAFT_118301 [Guillardia theta CCMP2712]|eukprot:XP_005822467.1 hypothetical protein GUITHDRAFT_118301 [Guillardia theta CCMP2712]
MEQSLQEQAESLEELWKGRSTEAGRGRAGNGELEVRIVHPQQGQHVVCDSPQCVVELELQVKGRKGNKREQAAAVLMINGQQAAELQVAEEATKTRVVDLSIGWHTIEVHARAGGMVAAHAASFRLVYLLVNSYSGEISFGGRGKARVVDREETKEVVVECLLVHEDGGERVEEHVDFALSSRSPSSLSSAAAQVAELFELGRIEMLQVYQGIDSFLFLRERLKLDAMRPLVPPKPYRKRWAVMSADSNSEYAFILPLAALVWDKLMRFQPLVLLIGKSWEQPLPESRQEVVLDMLRKMKFRVEVVPSSSSINTAAIAQVGRLYACLVEGIKDDDYLLTSDADLIPVSALHFDSERDWNKKLHLYNPFCCAPLLLPEEGLASAPDHIDQVRLGAPALSRYGEQASRPITGFCIFPSLTPGPKLKSGERYTGEGGGERKELMNLPRSEEEALRASGIDNILQMAVENRIIHDLGEEKARRNVASNLKHADLEMWHLDQRLWSSKVGAWQHFPGDVELIPRHGSRDRIDRMHWEIPNSLEGFIDAHLPQPGYDEVNWPQVRPLLEKLLRPLPDGERLLGLVDAYHDRYMLAFQEEEGAFMRERS